MPTKQPVPPPPGLPEPEFSVGTLVEILNNADRISLEDRMGIVREYCVKDVLSNKPYIAYNVELVTKPGVFRLRTKQFLKAADMPTKEPVPPPKFNIRDQVLYNFSRWQVTDRKYKGRDWIYELEAIEENKQGINNTEAYEKFITLSSPSPPKETKPMPDPELGYRLLSKDPPEDLQAGDEWWEHDEQRWRGIHPQTSKIQHPDLYYRRKVNPPAPKFMAGDLVWFKNCGREIQTSVYDHKKSEWRYKINMYPGGPEYDSFIKESELEPYNNPPTPQETKLDPEQGHFDDTEGKWIPEPNPFEGRNNQTVVNEQGGRQSHLDARFDCIPPVVLRLLAQCLGFGARKYGDENWKNIPQRDHLNHAMNHINEWNRSNRDEPHLVNAMARLTFALWQAVDSKNQPDTYIHPDDHDTKTTT